MKGLNMVTQMIGHEEQSLWQRRQKLVNRLTSEPNHASSNKMVRSSVVSIETSFVLNSLCKLSSKQWNKMSWLTFKIRVHKFKVQD